MLTKPADLVGSLCALFRLLKCDRSERGKTIRMGLNSVSKCVVDIVYKRRRGRRVQLVQARTREGQNLQIDSARIHVGDSSVSDIQQPGDSALPASHSSHEPAPSLRESPRSRNVLQE